MPCPPSGSTHIYQEWLQHPFLFGKAAENVPINKGSYMSAHVLLNLLNELRKRDKIRGLLSILYFF